MIDETTPRPSSACAPESPRIPDTETIARIVACVRSGHRLFPHADPDGKPYCGRCTHDWPCEQERFALEVEARLISQSADAALLDALDKRRGNVIDRCIGTGEPELLGHDWYIVGQCTDVRTAIRQQIEADARPKAKAPAPKPAPVKSDGLPF